MIFQESFSCRASLMLTRMDGRRTRSIIMIQVAALYRQSGSGRLEKQRTDLRRNPCDFGDGALASPLPLERLFGSVAPDFEVVLKLVKTFYHLLHPFAGRIDGL